MKGTIKAKPTPRPPMDLGLLRLPLLEKVRTTLGDCTRCRLHEHRKELVFGEGDAHASVMFIGEAPGEKEDESGRPFVGPAGQLLDKMIGSMGFRRAEVYITNTVKCRPPGNREPQPDEVDECSGVLTEQILTITPKVIISLGRAAAHRLLGVEGALGGIRGSVRYWTHDPEDSGGISDGGVVRIPLVPTWHPAYLLRSGMDAGLRREVSQDLRVALGILKTAGVKPPRAAALNR